MTNNRRLVFAALIAAGVLWGTTVPLSKLALAWLGPAWLAFGRFGVAATVLLLVAGRDKLRAMCRPTVLASGAVGYGGSVLLQNLGIVRTSVTHAALIVGATPVLIAIIAAVWQRTMAKPVAWAGFAVSLVGVALVASGKGGGATLGGDGLVLASQLISAGFTVAQVRLLRDRDPVAITGVQFLGAAIAVLPIAVITEGAPAPPSGLGSLLAAAGLAFCGTVLPFTLFAYAQSRVAADVAGAFLNLEPLVGALAGTVVFRDPVGPLQAAGGAAILIGIVLSSLQLRRAKTARRAQPVPEARAMVPAATIPGMTARPAAWGAGALTLSAGRPARWSVRQPPGHTGPRRPARRGGARRPPRPTLPAVARRPGAAPPRLARSLACRARNRFTSRAPAARGYVIKKTSQCPAGGAVDWASEIYEELNNV
jgi:O-acetylserine/cysteine efflux transporter